MMEYGKDALPPSPPMTDSGTSSRSTVPLTSPGETPPQSPQVRSSHSSSPSAAASPLPLLPVEVFSLVLSFLEQSDLERCLLVSRPWYAYVDGDPSLWSSLVANLDMDDQHRVERICRRTNVNGRRSSGGIRTLRLILGAQVYQGRLVERVTSEYAEQRLFEILSAVVNSSVLINTLDRPPDPRRPVYSTLTTLDLRLRPNSHVSACVLHKLADFASGALFANLKHFAIHTNLPRFQIREHVLRIFPRLSSLTIAVRSSRDPGIVEQPFNRWCWQPTRQALQHAPGSLACLQRLVLSDVWVSDLFFPLLPQLKSLELARVNWEGRSFFYLLRLARATLEELYCSDLVFESADDEFEDWRAQVDIRDPELVDGHIFPDDDLDDFPDVNYEPAPIILSSLRTLYLSGHTPPIFSSLDAFELPSDSDLLPTPTLVMPVLHAATLDGIEVEPENGPVDEAMRPLVTLGRSAPQLRDLDIRNTMTGDLALRCCLNAINGSIQHLDVSDTLVSDHLIVRLPDVAPELKTLDVRNCIDITCQGVARAVEVIRMRNDEGLTKVEAVHVNVPDDDADPACWRAYNWLDFVGVLRRDEVDFEGMGPQDSEVARKRWIKQGKEDSAKEAKEAYAAWEREQQEKRLREQAAQIMAQNAAAAASAGGSASGPVKPFTLDAFQQLSAAGKQFQQLSPAFAQQPHTPLPAAFIPSLSMAPSQTPTSTYSSNVAGFDTVPLPLRPAPPQPAQNAFAQQQPPFQLPPFPQLPPLAPHQQIPQQQQQYYRHPPASPPPLVQAASDKFDFTCLDSLESFDQLDPAFLAEQVKAMEQARNRNNRRLTAEIATAAMIERSREQDVAAAERAANVQRAKELYHAEQSTGVAARATAIRTPQELAALQALRTAHAPAVRAFSAPPTTAGTPMQMTPRVVTPTSTLTTSTTSGRGSPSIEEDQLDPSTVTPNEALVRAQLDEDYDDVLKDANGADEVVLGFGGFAGEDEEDEEVAEVELEKVA